MTGAPRPPAHAETLRELTYWNIEPQERAACLAGAAALDEAATLRDDYREALKLSTENLAAECDKVDALEAEAVALRARVQHLVAALTYVSAELRHMRLTHQLGPHTVRKVDSLIRHCEEKTTPKPASTEGSNG